MRASLDITYSGLVMKFKLYTKGRLSGTENELLNYNDLSVLKAVNNQCE